MISCIKNDYYLRKLLRYYTKYIIKHFNENAIIKEHQTVYYQTDFKSLEYKNNVVNNLPITKLKNEYICENKYNLLNETIFINHSSSLCLMRIVKYHIQTKNLSFEDYNCEIARANHILIKYTEYILDIIIEGKKIDDKQINLSIKALINDLSNELEDNGNKDVIVNLKVYLSHLLLENQFLLANNCYKKCLLRKPLVSDFNKERLSVNIFDDLQLAKETTAILELEIKNSYQESNTELNKLIDMLRLFELTAVHSLKIDVKSRYSILYRDASFLQSQDEHFRLIYTLKNSDITNLSDYIKDIKPIIDIMYNATDQNVEYLSIALRWYKESLLKEEIYEGCISASIISLEALFLNGSFEARYRLGLSIITLFKVLEKNYGIKLNKNEHELYRIDIAHQIRGKYLHGDIRPKKVTEDELSKVCINLLEINRLSILVFMSMHMNNQLIIKSDIISKIDGLVKAPNDNNKLKEFLLLVGNKPLIY
jgi:hypothetical protein